MKYTYFVAYLHKLDDGFGQTTTPDNAVVKVTQRVMDVKGLTEVQKAVAKLKGYNPRDVVITNFQLLGEERAQLDGVAL